MEVPCSTRKRSTGIDDLPDELLLEILYKLPAKFALRCKLVSKYWFSLISNPSFGKQSIHRNHHRFINRAIFEFACFDIEKPSKLCVVASFNDLLLYRGSLIDTRGLSSHSYYICNPFTRNWLRIPPTPVRDLSAKAALICYPYHCCRLASSSRSTNSAHQYSYKAVSLAYPIDENQNCCRKLIVETFCSKSNKWSFSLVRLPLLMEHPLSLPGDVVVCNGILHWLNKNQFFRQSIIVYDPIDNVEECRIIGLPEDINPQERVYCIGVCRGRLRIALLRNFDQILIWELNDYNSGNWKLEHCFYLGNVVTEDCRLMISTVWPTISVKIFDPYDADVIYLHYADCLVQCNLKTMTLKVIRSFQDSEDVDDPRVYRIPDFWWPTPLPPLPLPY